MDVTLPIGEEKSGHAKGRRRTVLLRDKSLPNNDKRTDDTDAKWTKFSRVASSLARTDVSPVHNAERKKFLEVEESYRHAALNVTRTPEKPAYATTSPQSLTPKTSPMPVNLTPHRSAKTPKKSPKNLTSPKTHSIAPLRLSKTPRKLPLTSGSPKISPRRYDTLTSETALHTKKSLGEATRGSTSRGEFVSKTPKKTSSASMKLGVRRFSKSPKIVLRSPKPKSRKSKSPKLSKVSSSKSTVTPRKSKGSSRKTNGLPAPEISISKTPKRSSPSTELIADLKNPVVVLQRLSTSTTDLATVLVNGKSSPSKTVSPKTKKLNCTENGLRTPMTRSRESTERPRNSKLFSLSKLIDTPLVDANHSLKEPLMSSTPQEKKAKQFSFGSTVTSDSGPLSRRSNRSRFADTSNPSIGNTTIENESEPSLYELDLPETKRINTLASARTDGSRIKEKDDKSNSKSNDNDAKDGTYELLEPKTPNLREKCRKRSFAEAKLNEKEEKRRCKVRFASPMGKTTSDTDIRRSHGKNRTPKTVGVTINKRASKALFGGTKTSIGRSRGTNISVSSASTSFRSPMSSRIERTKKSITQNNESTPPSSFSFSAINTDPKFSSTKKIPNFSEIHKKMFARSESLVDAKKRLRERHTALTAKMPVLPGSATDPLPEKPGKTAYNRFGFRLRKNEATESIASKCHMNPSSRKKKQQQQKQESRAMIKGVRTNRRFELQMRSRNVNAVG